MPEFVISNSDYITLIVTLSVLGVGTALFFVSVWMTPAWTFLMAKMRKADVHLLCNRGNKGRFFVGRSSTQGINEIKKVGSIILTEGSNIREHKSNINMFVSFGEHASTIPLWYPYVVEDLRSRGFKVENIDDYMALINKPTTGLFKEQIEYIAQYARNLGDDMKQKLADYQVNARGYKTLALHALQHMFPFNITPSSIESRVQHVVSIKAGLANKAWGGDVLKFALVMIIGGAIAFVIIWLTVAQGNDGGTAGNAASSVVGSVKAAASGASGAASGLSG